METMVSMATADLMDDFPEALVLPPVFRHFGGVTSFHGPVVTVDCAEDNSKVKFLLEKNGLCSNTGQPQILIVNGQGSLNCALLGDMIAKKAVMNHWAGVIIDGCVRDSAILATLSLGVLALAATPRKSVRQDRGQINPERFNIRGHKIIPGCYAYADADGVIILPEPVHLA